jgi:type IV secretion system protein VirB8
MKRLKLMILADTPDAALLAQNAGVDKEENFIATVAFDYKNTPSKEADFLVNPLGFQVLSYRVDPEMLP